MSVTLEQTSSQALSLAEKDRAFLAHILIASLGEEDRGYAAEWDHEIARRVNEIDRGVARGRDGSDVIGDIRSRYS